MKNSTIQQYEYHQWANDRFFDHLKELPEEVHNQQVKSVFSSISVVLAHIYQTDGMWLSVMAGDSFDETMLIINKLKEKSEGKDLPQMQELYAELTRQYQDFFERIDDLDAVISINHPRYGSLDTPVAELVKHVVNHGTYHRGNITAMLRQLGYTGVSNDYVFYLYDIAPEK